jgi:hypothetical protein
MTIGSVVVSEPSNGLVDGVDETVEDGFTVGSEDGFEDGFAVGLTDDVDGTFDGSFDPAFAPVPPRGNAFGIDIDLTAAPVGASGFWFGSAADRVRSDFDAGATGAVGLERDGFGVGVTSGVALTPRSKPAGRFTATSSAYLFERGEQLGNDTVYIATAEGDHEVALAGDTGQIIGGILPVRHVGDV